jgi:hypothetical protein
MDIVTSTEGIQARPGAHRRPIFVLLEYWRNGVNLHGGFASRSLLLVSGS